ncbi:RNA polymerase sigma-70 factor [Pedobacter africanus]|uniref:RNA polymerase sigma-70 factor, ECF subfamily n=1 Tax=Pedobacter africanus TaxID=151894 RepID=A0A1W2CRZ3_9SPHI|nr:RNA polymerase sigma-70 factor [Pedobacter africanus]SMC87438.1 RNA polymerase sigma-70 factor, ECF subfamily [Pedobacter africanus]
MTEYAELSDLEVLTLLKGGNQSAFSELYNRYKQALYFHANRSLKDHDEARDMVQEVFASLWTKRETMVIPEAVDAYLYRSIRNRILNFIAHKKVVTKYTDSIDAFLERGSSTTDEIVREKELKKILEYEISRLPEKMRVVFEMSRNQNLSYKQIAAELNINEQSVRKHAQRAIRILRLRIKLNLFFAFLC